MFFLICKYKNSENINLRFLYNTYKQMTNPFEMMIISTLEYMGMLLRI